MFFGFFNVNPFSFLIPSTNFAVVNQNQTQYAVNVATFSWGANQTAQNVGYQTAIIYQR